MAQWAEEILRRHAPYPKDNLDKEEMLSDQRFHVYRVSDTHHIIMDSASHLWEDTMIHTDLLLNPEFCVSDWYAKRCEPSVGIPMRMRRCMQNCVAMGDALGRHVEFLLNKETRFPGNHSMD